MPLTAIPVGNSVSLKKYALYVYICMYHYIKNELDICISKISPHYNKIVNLLAIKCIFN